METPQTGGQCWGQNMCRRHTMCWSQQQMPFVLWVSRTVLCTPKCCPRAPQLFCVQPCGCLVHVHKQAEHFWHLSAHSKNQTISMDLENMMESLSRIAGQMCSQQPEFAMDLLSGAPSVCCKSKRSGTPSSKKQTWAGFKPAKAFLLPPKWCCKQRKSSWTHIQPKKSTIISKATVLPCCWKSKWESVMSQYKTFYCFKHCCVYFTLSHSLCKETLRDKQEAWIVAWSLPEFPNISYFGPQDEFSLQTT